MTNKEIDEAAARLTAYGNDPEYFPTKEDIAEEMRTLVLGAYEECRMYFAGLSRQLLEAARVTGNAENISPHNTLEAQWSDRALWAEARLRDRFCQQDAPETVSSN